MSEKKEKSFDERLHSLKVGCMIFGIIEILGAVSNIISVSQNFNAMNLFSLIIALFMIADIFFMYQYTKERKLIGPILEYIFGALMLIQGILYCITIAGIIFGILFIMLSIGILKEAKYFKENI